MENNFVKNHPGLFVTGTIFLWYVIATTINLIWLANTHFSNLFVLKEAYLGMKPLGIPLPESGVLLFFLGTILIISTYLFTEKGIPKKQTFKYVLSVVGFSFLIFIFLVPVLVIGEILYYILINKICKSISWLEWLKDIFDMFTFKAKIQASFIKNPFTLDMSLGGFIVLYISMPKIRERLKI